MHKEFLETEQRPYPIPDKPWIMTQTWNHLLFCHWPVPTEIIKEHIPPQLDLDLINGQAWIGIIPFQVNHMRLHGLPEIPYIRSYMELNVRTYVIHNGTPGVYFFNLDANKWIDVLGARIAALLPYRKASMKSERNEQHTYFYSKCQLKNNSEILDVTYKSVSEPYLPSAASLEYWLFERYCFFTPKGKKLYRGDIHHDRWRVCDAEAEIRQNSMASFVPDIYKQSNPLLHFTKEKQVFVWMLKQVK